MMKRRLLLISPYFPPANVIGAKRAVNLAQGIHDTDGWDVVVLASRPFKEIDSNKTLPLPAGVNVVYGFESFLRPFVKWLVKLIFTPDHSKEKSEQRRAKKKTSDINKPPKKKLSYTPFDQYLWDVPGALKSGKKIIKKFKPDVIWVNADPWSGLLVGRILSKRTGIPWIVDMRDPWTVFHKRMLQRPKLTRKVIHHYERVFLETSCKVVFNTRNAHNAYSEVYGEELAGKFTYIRNAFNENLFEKIDKSEDKKFVFGYFGSFRSFVSSERVLEAFTLFIRKNQLTPDKVGLVINGSVDSQFWDDLDSSGISEFVSINEEVSLSETLSLLQSWDVLLMMVSPEYKWMVPAKLYDYLIAQKPIIAISDNQEVNEIIKKTESGVPVSFESVEAIADVFTVYFLAGKTKKLQNDKLIQPYGLQEQSRRFLEVLNGIFPESDQE